MRSFLPTLLIAFSSTSFAQPATAAADTSLEALMALARTYGVVRYFHPSDSLDKVDWNRFLAHAAERMDAVTDRKDIAPRLEELFAPVAEGFRVTTPGEPLLPAPQGDGPRVEWRHLGYGLENVPSIFASWRTHHDPLLGKKANPGYFQNQGRAEASVDEEPVARVPIAAGLEAQVPISLPMSATKIGDAQRVRLEALAKTIEASSPAADTATRAQAYADGIALWNVARHFYPYWAVAKVDWDEVLRKWLAAQPQSQTRAQLADSLRRLAAPMGDGQAQIFDPRAAAPRQFLPISIRPAGEQWVVDESRNERVKIGDVLVAVDGEPVARWYAGRAALEPGSEQHRRWRVREAFLRGANGAPPVKLRFMRGKQPVEATLAYDSPSPIGAPRLPAIQELKPGIFYVDVRRFSKPDFDRSLAALRDARGIVFDLRGYPTGDAAALASYWITGTDRAQWMSIPRFDQPFAQPTSGWTVGWQRERDAALEKPAKALLTDGRAIGFAESLAGYFPGQKTGPIVGEPTAGANGNVAVATLPSGIKFGFTGMAVMRHDGSILEGEGFKPDIPMIPTPEGIRAGRDEVLERAVAALESAAKP
jgi:C-terminal processing protease CtpA/Prc